LTDDIRIRRYDPVWRASAPFLRARKNDVHIPISFAHCQELLAFYPDADPDVCSLAILLHDIGWYQIDMVDIIEKGFGPNMMQSDVRFRHETEGVRMGSEILAATGWSQDVIKQVSDIIDGHDTRPQPRSLNDRIVRDADKLWRFSAIGAAPTGSNARRSNMCSGRIRPTSCSKRKPRMASPRASMRMRSGC
jgi:HD domain